MVQPKTWLNSHSGVLAQTSAAVLLPASYATRPHDSWHCAAAAFHMQF
jgi:hypothetical protein